MDLYPAALECGVSCLDYWQMSLSEITAVIGAFRKQKREQLRERCTLDYALAKLISYSVNAPDKFPDKTEVYPFLEKEQSDDEDWRLLKARINAMSRGKKGGVKV